MKRSRRIAVWLLAILAGVLAWAWFSPSGTGEYADSPDGRYRALASSFHRGTWFRGRVEYIGIEIVQSSTGKTVWKAERYPLPNETQPEFGDRSKKLIKWAADSRSLSVPVGDSADAVWTVP